MGTNTKIEWCDHTWNPWYGCPDDGCRSDGCDHCYARAWARRSGIVDFDREIRRAADATFFAPLSRTKYRIGDRVFVCSLSDFFHPAVPEDLRYEAIGVIAARPDLVWMFVTKRPDRIKPLWDEIEDGTRGRYVAPALCEYASVMAQRRNDGKAENVFCKAAHRVVGAGEWPMKNWWLYATVENQEQADTRIPALLSVPAAVRGISAEPLMGSLRIERYLLSSYDKAAHDPQMTGMECRTDKLNHVIVGGESGPGARPMHPNWVRSIRDQCNEWGVPYFFKQWGEWAEVYDRWVKCEATRNDLAGVVLMEPDGRTTPALELPLSVQETHCHEWDCWMKRVGKSAAGRELDGRTWDGMPEVGK